MAPVLVYLVVVAAVVYAMRANHHKRQAWRGAAAKLGMHYEAKGLFSHPTLSGSVSGYRVRVDMVDARGVNSGKRKAYTRYMVRYEAATSRPFTLSVQSFGSSLGTLLGRKDVEIGRADFDDRVIVDSDFPEAITEFLTLERRQIVLALLQKARTARITETRIEVQLRGHERNAAQVISLVRYLVDEVALELGIDNPAEPVAIASRTPPPPDPDARPVSPPAPGPDPGVGPPPPPVADSTRVPPPPGADPSRAVPPSDAPVNSVVTRTDSTDGTDLEADPRMLVAPGSDDTLGIDQQLVINDVFAPGRLSSERIAHFDSDYGGRRVEWFATVRSVHRRGERYDVDALVGYAGKGNYVSDEVCASFGADDVIAPGDRVIVTGTLDRLDGISRKIEIGDAAILIQGTEAPS